MKKLWARYILWRMDYCTVHGLPNEYKSGCDKCETAVMLAYRLYRERKREDRNNKLTEARKVLGL